MISGTTSIIYPFQQASRSGKAAWPHPATPLFPHHARSSRDALSQERVPNTVRHTPVWRVAKSQKSGIQTSLGKMLANMRSLSKCLTFSVQEASHIKFNIQLLLGSASRGDLRLTQRGTALFFRLALVLGLSLAILGSGLQAGEALLLVFQLLFFFLQLLWLAKQNCLGKAWGCFWVIHIWGDSYPTLKRLSAIVYIVGSVRMLLNLEHTRQSQMPYKVLVENPIGQTSVRRFNKNGKNGDLFETACCRPSLSSPLPAVAFSGLLRQPRFLHDS